MKKNKKTVGEHLLECALLKGMLIRDHPQPKYNSTWDVQVVLNHNKTLQNYLQRFNIQISNISNIFTFMNYAKTGVARHR